MPAKPESGGTGADGRDSIETELEAEPWSLAVLDSLGIDFAVVDESGVVLDASYSRRGASDVAALLHDLVTEGSSFLHENEEATREDDDTRALADGIRDVVERRKDEYAQVYRSRDPGRGGWFKVRAARCAAAGQRRVVVTREDVTDWKLVEEALNRSEEQLRTVLDHAQAAIFLKDLDGRYVVINRRFEQLFGLSERGAIGKTDYDFLPRDVADAFKANDRRALATGKPVEVEEVAPHADGMRTSIVIKVPLLDANGGAFAVCGIATDITERKRAEATIAEQARLAEFSRDLSLLLIKDLSLREMLNRCAEVAARHLDAALVRIWTAEDPGARLDRQASAGPYSNRPEVHALATFEKRVVDDIAGNRRRYDTNGLVDELDEYARSWAHGVGLVSFTGLPLILDDRPVGVLAVFARHELSQTALRKLESVANSLALGIERKRAMEALRKSEERLRLALDATQMGSWDWELATDRVIWSGSAAAVFGRPGGGFGGTFHDFYESVHPDDRASVAEAIDRSIDEGAAYEVEFRVCRQDGVIRWMSGKGKVVCGSDGRPTRLVGIGMDITDRKSAEREISVLNAELEGRLERLNALRKIDQAITGCHDLDLTLGIVLDQVLSRLRVDAAGILLADPHAPSLEYAIRRGYRGGKRRDELSRLDREPVRRAIEDWKIQHVSAPSGAVAGASDDWMASEGFVEHWAVPLTAKGRVLGVLEVGHRSPLSPDDEWREFLEALGGQAAIAIDNAGLLGTLHRSNLELSLAYDATIEGWARAMDLRDHETVGHSRRVTKMTVKLARAMNVADAELVHFRRGAILHDIGKIGVPDSILRKRGRLTPDEAAVMRRHPQYALELLSPIAFLREALEIPYCHHEKWDGSGYPRGLKGEQIPLSARIFAAVDIWDALRSDRPYRKALPPEVVYRQLRSYAGTHLDPDIVPVFINLLEGETV